MTRLGQLRSITVYVSYRMDAGRSSPSWKALRARVVQDSADGPVYGRDLVPPSITNPDMLVARCLISLDSIANEVIFRFSPELKHEPVRFWDNRMVPFSDADERTA